MGGLILFSFVKTKCGCTPSAAMTLVRDVILPIPLDGLKDRLYSRGWKVDGGSFFVNFHMSKRKVKDMKVSRRNIFNYMLKFYNIKDFRMGATRRNPAAGICHRICRPRKSGLQKGRTWLASRDSILSSLDWTHTNTMHRF